MRLTPTSYVVLGLVEQCEPATPYEIKQVAEVSTRNFWTVPHTQLYTESARLAKEGLLDEERERAGRRRRVYRLTPEGRAVLERWRSEPAAELMEQRDLGMLKLFFGADPADLADGQLALHEAKLREYQDSAKLEMTAGMRLALEAGIGHEKEFIRFWKKLAGSV